MYTQQLTITALMESAERAAFWLMNSAQITNTGMKFLSTKLLKL